MPVVRGDSLGFPGALSLVVEGRARAPLLSRLVSMVCSRPAEGDASLEMRFVVDLDPGAENDHGRDAIRFAQGASVVLSQGLADAGSPLFEGVVTARGMECFEAGAPQVSSLSLAQNLAAGGTGDPAAHPGPVSGWLDVPGWFMPAPGADLVLRGTGSLFDGPLHAVAAEFTLDVTAVRTRVRVHRD
jgi:hypothetical protein